MAQPKLPKVQRPTVTRDNDLQMSDPFELIPIHMAVDEAQALDALQGGPEFIDGVRSYERLAPIFEEPEVQQEFLRVHKELDENDPKAQEMYEVGKKVLPPWNAAPADNSGPIGQIEDMGVGGDGLLVLMPQNMLIFFSILSDGLRKNPNTGLYALGNFFEDIGRGARDTFKNPGNFARTAVAVVGGGLLGGPVGALGATMGHLHGQGRGEKGFGGALRGFGLAKLGEFGLNSLGVGLPSVAGIPGLGAAANGMNSLGQMGANAGAAMGLPQASGQHGFMGSLGAGLKQGTNNLMGGSPVSGAGGMLGGAAGGQGGLGSIGNLALLQQGLTLLGEQQNYKREQERYEQEKREREEMYNRSGLGDRWAPPEARRMPRPPYGMPTSEEFREGRSPYSGRYASGGSVGDDAIHHIEKAVLGLIKGPGKGQADQIRTSVPSGTYITDASSVGMLGDGSSEAGAKALEKAIHLARRKHGHKVVRENEGGSVPVYLSNDEYAIAPEDVAAFGGGNENKGAYILKGMVKELRKHKNSNGDRLPPRAKDVWQYIKLSGRAKHA